MFKGVHANTIAVICNIRTHSRKIWISLLDNCIRVISTRLLSVVIIHYPQIGNEPILNASKNNFDRFLIF
jgi:hypothetical protein